MIHVGTKYIYSQKFILNISVSCKMLLIKLYINGRNVIAKAWIHTVENVVKFYVPYTWSTFAGPVT